MKNWCGFLGVGCFVTAYFEFCQSNAELQTIRLSETLSALKFFFFQIGSQTSWSTIGERWTK